MEGKVGEYIGSGVGKVNGSGINGNIYWTLFEAKTDTVCQSNLFGVITTDDGTEIKFSSMGIFLVPEPDKPKLWATSAGVSFHTEHEQNSCQINVAAVWEDEFDMKSYRHRYQVYARSI